VHWSFSLLGAFGCFAVMLLINAIATIVAIVFISLIFFWLEQRKLKSVWGDLGRGLWMAVVRQGLMRLGAEYEPKTWRPNPLVLSGAPQKRWHLIEFAKSITSNRGLMTVATVVPDDKISNERLEGLSDNIYSVLDKQNVQGLVRVVANKDPFKGSVNLVQAYGLGKLVPNTIILGDSENAAIRDRYVTMIRQLYEMKRNIILIRDKRGLDHVFGEHKEIHLWWGGFQGNGGLMIILAYLLQQSDAWRYAKVRLKMILNVDQAEEEVRQNIRSILQEIRIDAEIDVIHREGRTFPEILRSSSSDADLIILGMKTPDDTFLKYYEGMQEMTANLPTTAFVLAGQDISFGDVLIQKDTMTSN
jgi:hypothetical protein